MLWFQHFAGRGLAEVLGTGFSIVRDCISFQTPLYKGLGGGYNGHPISITTAAVYRRCKNDLGAANWRIWVNDSWFIGFVEYSDKEKIAEHGISLKPMIGEI